MKIPPCFPHCYLRFPVGLLVVLSLSIISSTISAQVPAAYYKQNCMSCHTIGGGRLTGPDLKNVEERQGREWLVSWILDPEGVLASGDPYSARLLKEARGAVMARSPGITYDLANALLDLIEVESGLEVSQFKGIQISDRALLPDDIVEGRALFMGTTPLKNGGPACIGCHHVNSIGILGGGHLGLNLTRVYAKLEGRNGLAAWLAAPPSLTMSPVYTPQPIDEEEILPLIAFLKDETEKDNPEGTSSVINFLLSGIIGAGVLLVIFDRLWGNRFRAVRRPLIDETYRDRRKNS
ncbi:MAG: c-type cytochrome [Candidatus Latescibacteria bacterium]|nr:c-type cytochrome [Candidatus Latescibacterota bacterium]